MCCEKIKIPKKTFRDFRIEFFPLKSTCKLYTVKTACSKFLIVQLLQCVQWEARPQNLWTGAVGIYIYIYILEIPTDIVVRLL
jgi:hypothetical protein